MSLIDKGERWKEAHARLDKMCCEQSGSILGVPRPELQNYGSQFYRPYSHRHTRILSPAGSRHAYRFKSGKSAQPVYVIVRQREIARYGLPDLFEAWISVKNEESGEWHDISESIPAHTEDEAIKHFYNALHSIHANALAKALGDDLLVRLFGIAISPKSLEDWLSIPAPTLTDLHLASAEIREATTALDAVFKKWEGTDALRYLVDDVRPMERRRFLHWRVMNDIARLADGMNAYDVGIEAPERRAGRRVKGGRENVVARALASLWCRCGLGVPKFSPQSRFVRACSIVLPWHDVHKADVGQFMRGEIEKKRQGRVLIG